MNVANARQASKTPPGYRVDPNAARPRPRAGVGATGTHRRRGRKALRQRPYKPFDIAGIRRLRAA